ncbi:uncharacterized protein LOC144349574 isoform X1 [Saccoglossus kowalevskii]
MELQQISSERESRQRLVDDDRVHGEYRAVYQQRSIQDARVNDDGFRVIIHQPTPQPTQQMYRLLLVCVSFVLNTNQSARRKCRNKHHDSMSWNCIIRHTDVLNHYFARVHIYCWEQVTLYHSGGENEIIQLSTWTYRCCD